MLQCYNHLLSNFCSGICQVPAYGGLIIKEIFKLLALKGVMVANERRSLTRGSKYIDLTRIYFRYLGELAIKER